MANKRKRDERCDSDSDDEVTPGRQILPVANLPHDFDQEPQDGLQYLFLVRRDARRLPNITRVPNPYEVSGTKGLRTFTPLSTIDLPCDEWRIAFQTHFSNLRKNLTQATIYADSDGASLKRRLIPEKKDRDAWWKFFAGHPESRWSPKNRSSRKKPSVSTRVFADAEALGATSFSDVATKDASFACLYDLPQEVTRRSGSFDPIQSVDSADLAIDLSASSKEILEENVNQLLPPEVTPTHLREIDHRLSLHLLMYFTHWINIHLQNSSDPLTTISASHGRWMFALLTRVEDQLSADEMNLLRNLARACLRLIQVYSDNSESGGTVPMKSETQMSDASCWMIFTAVAGHWGQRDLWTDAKDTLSAIP